MLITVGRLMVASAVSGGGGSFSGILDSVTETPVGAWDIGHRLTGNYTGSLIRLRRASDDTEMDFGYDANGDLDTASIATFLSATTGHFRTIYDQVGANDLIQATDANQPAYSATAFNSGPGADFTAASLHLMTADGVAASFTGDDQPATFFGAIQCTTGVSMTPVSCGNSANTTSFFKPFDSDSVISYYIVRRGDTGGQAFASATGRDADPHILTSVFYGTTGDFFEESDTIFSGGAVDADSVTLNQFTVGAQRGSSNSAYFDGQFAGLIAFDTSSVTEQADLITDYMALKSIV